MPTVRCSTRCCLYQVGIVQSVLGCIQWYGSKLYCFFCLCRIYLQYRHSFVRDRRTAEWQRELVRTHELRTALIDATGSVCEQRFSLVCRRPISIYSLPSDAHSTPLIYMRVSASIQSFVGAETETGKIMSVGVIVASHDTVENLTLCLRQLDIALNQEFKPTYVCVLSMCHCISSLSILFSAFSFIKTWFQCT